MLIISAKQLQLTLTTLTTADITCYLISNLEFSMLLHFEKKWSLTYKYGQQQCIYNLYGAQITNLLLKFMCIASYLFQFIFSFSNDLIFPITTADICNYHL